MAIAAVVVAVLFAYLASHLLPHANLSLVFLTAVLIVASHTGMGPALLTAVLSFLVYNFLFTPPQFTFLVHDDGDVATLLFFLVMASIAGNLAVRLRFEAQNSIRSLEHVSTLYEFSQRMSTALDRSQVLERLYQQLSCAIDNTVILYHADDMGGLSVFAASDAGVGIEHTCVVDAWSGAEALPDCGWVFHRLSTHRGPSALVAVRSDDDELDDLPRGLCEMAALALDRVDLASDLSQAQLQTETEQLRSALLSSVSHDLRTPLASVIGSASTLQELGDGLSRDNRQELLANVLNESRRLDRYIQNLLDMTRLGQGELKLNRDWVEAGDLVASAIQRLRRSGQAEVPIDVQLAADVPLLWIHGVLIEQALLNLLDNAVRFTPEQGQISIDVRVVDDAVAIDVIDQGPGIPLDMREKVFDMFYTLRQGDRVDRQGTGLGLAICRGLVTAHGGTVTAATGHDGRGTRMRILIPFERRGAE